MKKYEVVTSSITRRIMNGEYQLTTFPTVRELASEAGVSLVTAQKVMKTLQEQGLITKGPKGRLDVVRNERAVPFQVAYLDNVGPEYKHLSVGWIDYLRQAAAHMNCAVRHVLYEHWDDAVIADTLNSFDGVFLVPLPTRTIPESVVAKIREKRRVVLVDGDYSHLGLPCILFYPPVFVQRLLDHLAGLGHRQIDCLNVQPLKPDVEARITQWQLWMAARQYTGRLINDPVEIGGSAMEQGYKITLRELEQKRLTGSALLCNTGAAALGAMRAFRERNIRVGTDIALCATYYEEAPYLSPTLTTLAKPDITPFFAICLDWMQREGTPWPQSLLMQPQDVELVIGESTVPNSNLIA